MRAEELGNLITFHRRRAGLTQIGLAELSGVSRSVVQDLEAGKGRTVWEHLSSILTILNIELEPVGPLIDDWKRTQETSE